MCTKWMLRALALAVFVSSTAAPQEAFDKEGWGWESPVEVESAETKEFIRVELTPDFADKCQASWNDIRVLDDDGVLVPHIVHGKVLQKGELVWQYVKLINRTHKEGEYTRVTLDFGARTLRNTVRVKLSGGEFRRYALLEGSETGKDWETVDSTWLFFIRHGGKEFFVNTFQFPENDFPFLRLSVSNMEDEAGRIEIRGVDVARHVPGEEPEYTEVNIDVQRVVPGKNEKDQTIIDIDTGYRRLPLHRVYLDIHDKHFYRAVALEGRDRKVRLVRRRTETGWKEVEEEEPWVSLTSGVVYRIADPRGEKESLGLGGFRRSYRYLRVRIFNGDDAPLDVGPHDIGVEREALPSIVFQNEPGKNYRVVCGNPKAGAARYDLAKSVRGLQTREMPVGILSPVMALPGTQAMAVLPLTERYVWGVWAVLILATAAVIGLIAKNLKKLKPE